MSPLRPSNAKLGSARSQMQLKEVRDGILILPGNRYRAVSGEVLPAISQGTADIGRTRIMPDEGTGLEQIGPSSAGIGDAVIGAAPRQREAGDRERREAIVGTEG